MRELYDIIYKATHKAPNGACPKQIASDLGIAVNTLIRRVNIDYPDRPFRVEDLPALVNSTGDDTPLHFICEKSGGVFLRLPKAEGRVPVHVACMDSIDRFGKLMTECSEALADGRVTLDEADKLADAGYMAIHEIYRLLKTAEQVAR